MFRFATVGHISRGLVKEASYSCECVVNKLTALRKCNKCKGTGNGFILSHGNVQLRDEVDAGCQPSLGEDTSIHDVAALLKEYFRDLPDPLLTRDLYSAFIATRSK